MKKKRINRDRMMYSADSITLKGFIAFKMMPLILTPMAKSNEIINVNKIPANKQLTNNIFKMSPSNLNLLVYGTINVLTLIVCFRKVIILG